ncbi:hypothetical protein CTAYLR_005026 [Chrysophaeum taylorii]|uniref:protein-disulfide reductase n=1 Tax=Chrysophaeum taylorii TaxID=2483200 RepID=A0AAD7UBJ9_9STRA|nr:hypothetical protein CTAYLR_005026 [Chrysophaeum taylorii]
MQYVLRCIMTPGKRRIECPEMLLHNCLRHRNITESQLLAVLRVDPGAAGRPDHVGLYPLHLMSIYTAWPTVTMIRELAKVNPEAAATRGVAGWLPLHLFCANAIARGESRPRVTPDLLRAMRAVYPAAASESLADKKTRGARTPAMLFPKVVFPGRDECLAVLDEESDDVCCATEKAAADKKESHAATVLRRAELSADRDDIAGVCDALLAADGEFAGITDVVEPLGGRVLLHRCFERCAMSLTQPAVSSLLAASPTAAFLPDANGMLPLHVLLASCDSQLLTGDMVKHLVDAHPAACLHKGPRGWLPLHIWAARDPDGPAALSVLVELLRASYDGKRAARVKDDAGNLPVHIFSRTASSYKLIKDEEYRAFVGSRDERGGDDEENDKNDIVVPRKEPWDSTQPCALVSKLLEAYPSAWNIPDGNGRTPAQLAPVELREIFLNFFQCQETRTKSLVVVLPDQKTEANSSEQLTIASALENRNDEELANLVRKSSLLLGSYPPDLEDIERNGDTFLHRLLQREQPVGKELFLTVLNADPQAATVESTQGWYCAHLLCKRAASDPAAGVSSILACLLKAHGVAAYRAGGGKRKLASPLHVLCTMLSRHNHQVEPSTGESREAFDSRLVSFMMTLVRAAPGACDMLDARGKKPCDLIPNAPYFDVFRGVCFPRPSAPPATPIISSSRTSATTKSPPPQAAALVTHLASTQTPRSEEGTQSLVESLSPSTPRFTTPETSRPESPLSDFGERELVFGIDRTLPRVGTPHRASGYGLDSLQREDSTRCVSLEFPGVDLATDSCSNSTPRTSSSLDEQDFAANEHPPLNAQEQFPSLPCSPPSVEEDSNLVSSEAEASMLEKKRARLERASEAERRRPRQRKFCIEHPRQLALTLLRRRNPNIWVVETTMALAKHAVVLLAVVAMGSEISFEAIVDTEGTTARFVLPEGSDVTQTVHEFCDKYVNSSFVEQCRKAMVQQIELVEEERRLPPVVLDVQVDADGTVAKFEHRAGYDARVEATAFCAQYVLADDVPQCANTIVAAAIRNHKLEKMSLWEKLFGSELAPSVSAASAPVDGLLGSKQFVAILFAADWCGPCRQFVPKLAKVYDRVRRRNGDRLEVVWVSGSRDAGAFRAYHSEMPWPAMPFDPKRSAALQKAFQVVGFPTLLILDKEGRLVTADGVKKVSADPFGLGFPYRTPAQRIAHWSRASFRALRGLFARLAGRAERRHPSHVTH